MAAFVIGLCGKLRPGKKQEDKAKGGITDLQSCWPSEEESSDTSAAFTTFLKAIGVFLSPSYPPRLGASGEDRCHTPR